MYKRCSEALGYSFQNRISGGQIFRRRKKKSPSQQNKVWPTMKHHSRMFFRNLVHKTLVSQCDRKKKKVLVLLNLVLDSCTRPYPAVCDIWGFKRGSVPSRCTLGSAVFHQFFVRNGSIWRALRGGRRLRRKGPRVPSSSAFVLPLRLFRSSRFSRETGGKPAVENTIQI